jgi:hypothetical protein
MIRAFFTFNKSNTKRCYFISLSSLAQLNENAKFHFNIESGPKYMIKSGSISILNEIFELKFEKVL